MIAGKYNITAYRNRDYVQIFEFDFDITGFTFEGSIDYVDTNINLVITKLTNLQIQVELTNATLSLLNAGVYAYDIKMTNGYISQIIEGSFTIKETITL